jgi:hypothetical protein
MPHDFCTRLTAKIRRLGYPRRHAERLAPVVENVVRIRERHAESKREIDVLFEGLMAGVFTGQLA